MHLLFPARRGLLRGGGRPLRRLELLLELLYLELHALHGLDEGARLLLVVLGVRVMRFNELHL